MSTKNAELDRNLSSAQKKSELAHAYKLKNQFQDVPWTVSKALTKGGWETKLSILIMGFGNMVHGQIVKGLLWLAMEILFILYMIKRGVPVLSKFGSLGSGPGEKVWDEAANVYRYTEGDNSVLILLWGVISIAMIVTFFFIWRSALKSAYKAEYVADQGYKPNSIKEDIASLFDQRIHHLLLTLPITGSVVFTVLPLLFMMTMAFTSYSVENNKLVSFDWVGLKNFVRVLNTGNSIGQTFWPVLGWTMIWAISATLTTFFGGLCLALLIHRKRTKGKAFWRVAFAITIAIPQYISLLVVRQMLNQTGPVNMLLMDAGWIDKPLPFWTNATWARVTVIIVNLWVGIPHTLLQVTGILENFPEDYWEAAEIDGANGWQKFWHITMPYIISIMGPFLITQFTGNVNNFNVIFLLTAGGPPRFGSTAGYTDLLVTWLYSLTVDNRYYNIGAVVGIFTFIVLSIIALTLYRITPTARKERGDD